MRTAWILLACAVAVFAAHQRGPGEKPAAAAVRQVVVYQEPGPIRGLARQQWHLGMAGRNPCRLHARILQGKRPESLDRRRSARQSGARAQPRRRRDVETGRPGELRGRRRNAAPAPAGIDFGNPNLAIRVGGPPPYHQTGNSFFVSLDRGRRWRGPTFFQAWKN